MKKNLLEMPSVPNKRFGAIKPKGKMLYVIIGVLLFFLIGLGTSLYWIGVFVKWCFTFNTLIN